MSNETIDRKRGRQDLKELALLAAEMQRTPPPPAASSDRLSSPLIAPPPSARISMEPMLMPTPQPFQPMLGLAPPAKPKRSLAPAMFIGACVVVAGCAIAITATVMRRQHTAHVASAIFVAPPSTATQVAAAPPAADPIAAPPAPPPATSISPAPARPDKPARATKTSIATSPKAQMPKAPAAANAPAGGGLDDMMRKAVGK
jgi:hypothetical protein